jgi:ribosomal protein S12 methylthiotransferase
MKTKNVKNISVITLGCAKNVYDSEKLIGMLEGNNLKYTEDINNTDGLIINTCGFIEASKQESIDYIFQACEMKKSGKLQSLIVMGCLVERYKKELASQIDAVDHFVGVNSQEQIVKMLVGDEKFSLINERVLLTPKHSAFLKISEGCDHKCGFCAIPGIRGKHISRPIDDILDEAKKLVDGGTKEIVVIAQDTTFYGKDLYGERRIAELAEKLSDIKGLDWVRFMYAYPTAYPLEFLDVMASRDNICNYVDIPLQHISDSVLKSMRRGITGDRIRELIDTMRHKVPGISIRSTFITGYPNETEKDFEELLTFIEEYKLDRVGVFTYSREDGTPSYELLDPIPLTIKQERAEKLMILQQQISLNINESKIDSVRRVLIDEINEDGSYFGRTEHDAPEVDNGVIFTSDQKLNIGEFVNVKITHAEEYDLFGTTE